MHNLTQEGKRVVAEIAERYGFSEGAVADMLFSLAAGQGAQAQFNNAEFGGMGQWSSNGMVMIGDMFNQDLKARVNRMCVDLAQALRAQRLVEAPPVHAPSFQSQFQGGGGQYQSGGGHSSSVSWSSFPQQSSWPESLGRPSSAGAQNNVSYAFFPETHRLAIRVGDRLSVYDTGGAVIGGFSQQQGGAQSMTFTTQNGVLSLEDLKQVSLESERDAAPERHASDHEARGAQTAAHPQTSAVKADSASGDVFAQLEKLADLHQKGVLTAEEFASKKTELLKRL